MMQRSSAWAGSALAVCVCVSMSLPAPADEPLCQGYSGVPGPLDMVRIAGGSFTMGDNDERPEEKQERRVTVSSFWIDRHEVTNAQFARFVAATGYITTAEKGLDAKRFPAMPAALRQPGSMVFSPPTDPVDLSDPTKWWRYVSGANWRAPLGPGSTIDGLDNHPVVHVTQEDAKAYAVWAGRDVPTEAEWEFAARGGLEGARYSWGDSYDPLEGWKANSWQGTFPHENSGDDGYTGTAPVGCFEANGYGLYDMTGNVWEIAQDYWAPGHAPFEETDPQGPGLYFAMRFAGAGGPKAVVKGGSWLCTPQFCLRYRPSARQPQEMALGSNHIGFRTVRRE